MKIDRLGRETEIRANAMCNVINSQVSNSPDRSDLLGDKPMQFGKRLGLGKALSDRLLSQNWRLAEHAAEFAVDASGVSRREDVKARLPEWRL
jgi:hypothetical protein